MHRRSQEPELLKEEKQQVERNILGTSVSNYGAFVEAARCLHTIDKELSNVNGCLEELLQVGQSCAPCSAPCASAQTPQLGAAGGARVVDSALVISLDELSCGCL